MVPGNHPLVVGIRDTESVKVRTFVSLVEAVDFCPDMFLYILLFSYRFYSHPSINQYQLISKQTSPPMEPARWYLLWGGRMGIEYDYNVSHSVPSGLILHGTLDRFFQVCLPVLLLCTLVSPTSTDPWRTVFKRVLWQVAWTNQTCVYAYTCRCLLFIGEREPFKAYNESCSPEDYHKNCIHFQHATWFLVFS